VTATSRTAVSRRGLPRPGGQQLLFWIILAIVALFVLTPMLLILVNSFAGSAGWTLDNWRTAWSDASLRTALWNTGRVLLANEAISMPLAVLLAWLLGRTDLPARGALEFLFWITFFLPALSVTLGWIVLLDPQYGFLNQLALALPFVESGPFDIYSFWGIVWAHLSTASLSVKVMLLTPLFRNLDASFEEAGRVSGASRLGVLWRLTVPMMAPAILTVLTLSIIRAIQSFEIEMVLGPPINFFVFGTKIYQLVAKEPPAFGAATALAVSGFVLIVPLVLLQRRLLASKDYVAIGGRIRTEPTPLGRWRWPVFAVVAGLCLTVTVLPVAFLLLASCMKLFGFFHLAEPWTFAHWRDVLGGDFFLHAALTTVKMAAGAAALSVLLCSLTAYFIIRGPRPGRDALDFLSWLPFAIPGILLGVGLLYLLLSNAALRLLYGSILVLMLATVIATLTLGIQILKSAMQQLGSGLEEAARTSGASWSYSFRHVLLPILAPSLVLVGMVNFIASARDIASIALLAANDTKTLSLLQLDYMTDGRWEAASVISVVVILLTTGLALAGRAFGLRLGIR
jgi:iron(III) transport system permease protein